MNTEISNASFPLTPALSLEERENRSPIVGEANTFDRSVRFPSKEVERGGSEIDVRRNKDASGLFPLPEGEGKGEGKGGLRMSVAPRAGRPATFFCLVYRTAVIRQRVGTA